MNLEELEPYVVEFSLISVLQRMMNCVIILTLFLV